MSSPLLASQAVHEHFREKELHKHLSVCVYAHVHVCVSGGCRVSVTHGLTASTPGSEGAGTENESDPHVHTERHTDTHSRLSSQHNVSHTVIVIFFGMIFCPLMTSENLQVFGLGFFLLCRTRSIKTQSQCDILLCRRTFVSCKRHLVHADT